MRSARSPARLLDLAADIGNERLGPRDRELEERRYD
jgi:hypothetical protein